MFRVFTATVFLALLAFALPSAVAAADMISNPREHCRQRNRDGSYGLGGYRTYEQCVFQMELANSGSEMMSLTIEAEGIMERYGRLPGRYKQRFNKACQGGGLLQLLRRFGPENRKRPSLA